MKVRDDDVLLPMTLVGAYSRQVFMPAEQLGLPTDCALSSIRRIVARKKLANMVKGAEIVRSELEGR